MQEMIDQYKGPTTYRGFPGPFGTTPVISVIPAAVNWQYSKKWAQAGYDGWPDLSAFQPPTEPDRADCQVPCGLRGTGVFNFRFGDHDTGGGGFLRGLPERE
jgi:hypothetical protein